MGFFDKLLKADAVLLYILKTFAQSIDAVEKGNQVKLNQAWDLFINTLGYLIDGKFLTEIDAETLVSESAFPENHSLTIDLIKLRNSLSTIESFVQLNKRSLEVAWSPRGLGDINQMTSARFVETLNKVAEESYPKFGASEADNQFVAILAIFISTLILETEDMSNSNRTYYRVMAYEFALRWLAEWNHRFLRDLMRLQSQ